MFDVKKMIEEIAAKKEIKNVSFVGCGGSLACFFAPHYYVTHEAKTLTTLWLCLITDITHPTMYMGGGMVTRHPGRRLVARCITKTLHGCAAKKSVRL